MSDAQQPLSRPPAPPGAGAALAAYPALAHVLGEQAFAELAAAVLARAAELSVEAGAVVHSLLLQRVALRAGAPRADVLRTAGASSRLAADVAAVERALEEVARIEPDCRDATRVAPADLASLSPAAWDAAVLQPLRALRIVPVAWRIDGFVRRLHAGGRPPPAPRRCEQHVVVSALARCRPPDNVWCQGLPPGEGRLLSWLALGTPLGLATRESVARGDVVDAQAARRLLDGWLREGFFTELLADA